MGPSRFAVFGMPEKDLMGFYCHGCRHAFVAEIAVLEAGDDAIDYRSISKKSICWSFFDDMGPLCFTAPLTCHYEMKHFDQYY